MAARPDAEGQDLPISGFPRGPWDTRVLAPGSGGAAEAGRAGCECPARAGDAAGSERRAALGKATSTAGRGTVGQAAAPKGAEGSALGLSEGRSQSSAGTRWDGKPESAYFPRVRAAAAGETAAFRGPAIHHHDTHLCRGRVWRTPQHPGTRITPRAASATPCRRLHGLRLAKGRVFSPLIMHLSVTVFNTWHTPQVAVTTQFPDLKRRVRCSVYGPWAPGPAKCTTSPRLSTNLDEFFYLPWKAKFDRLRSAILPLAFLGSWKMKIKSPGMLQGTEVLSYKHTTSCRTEDEGCAGNKRAETVPPALRWDADALRCRQLGGCPGRGLCSGTAGGQGRVRAGQTAVGGLDEARGGARQRAKTQRCENSPLGAEAFSGRKAGEDAD